MTFVDLATGKIAEGVHSFTLHATKKEAEGAYRKRWREAREVSVKEIRAWKELLGELQRTAPPSHHRRRT